MRPAPRRDRPQVLARIRGAWALENAELAGRRLKLLASELEHTWRDAAGSLREGIEDTLTLTRLGITAQLPKTLSSTNPCESMIAIVNCVQDLDGYSISLFGLPIHRIWTATPLASPSCTSFARAKRRLLRAYG